LSRVKLPPQVPRGKCPSSKPIAPTASGSWKPKRKSRSACGSRISLLPNFQPPSTEPFSPSIATILRSEKRQPDGLVSEIDLGRFPFSLGLPPWPPRSSLHRRKWFYSSPEILQP